MTKELTLDQKIKLSGDMAEYFVKMKLESRFFMCGYVLWWCKVYAEYDRTIYHDGLIADTPLSDIEILFPEFYENRPDPYNDTTKSIWFYSEDWRSRHGFALSLKEKLILKRIELYGPNESDIYPEVH